jgi:hypothetical protein
MKPPSIYLTHELTELLKPFVDVSGRPLKLIIHAGTPKTGTTSIQSYLDKNQRKLRGKGILYPHNIDRIKNPHAPKHQWVEKNLVTTHIDYFLENFKNIVAQITEDTHTIILSSEGIYNYWWDFPEASTALLSELRHHFDTEIWVWFREPLAFIEDFYKQCMRNPRVESNPCYGRDLSFSDMLDIKWFSQHLDYQGFVNDCQALFGEDKVLAFKYEGDVVQALKQKLGVATPHDNSTPRLNNSLDTTAIALLRVINNYDVSAKDKHLLMPYLRKISEVTENYATAPLIDVESSKRVLDMAKPVQF